MKLLQAEIGRKYIITKIDLPESYQRHIANLGLIPQKTIMLLSKNKDSAIMIVASQRLAFDKSIIDNITVEPEDQNGELVPLTSLTVGQGACIDSIYTSKETKRHLMDLGLTRGTEIKLIKIAPLGDPLEISLRGFELTLRKSEAQLISVRKATDD